MYQQICNNDGYLRARLMEIAAQLSDLRRETGINNVSIKIQGNKSGHHRQPLRFLSG